MAKLAHFGGLPVADLRTTSSAPGFRRRPAEGVRPHERPADAVAWLLRRHAWTDSTDIHELYSYFVDNVDTTRVTALVLGAWSDTMSGRNPLLDLLAADADRFPALRHLFVNDVSSEETEISWLALPTMKTILDAYPRLEELGLRGCSMPSRPGGGPAPVRHLHLRRLRVESGGVSGEAAQAIALSDLPALEELELWLGVDNYGGDATLDDLADIFAGTRLPKLRHLGLMNSELQDEIAEALAGAPIVSRLESLDLSMGVLSDAGAEALLSGQPLGHLKKLRIDHHFVGDPMAERLRRALAGSGTTVDISAPEERDEWDDDEIDGRYVEVSE
ncbi:STM4015 family protein [Yinghuangia sp. ASG 101]|uniref:STM4015 family protein n=1 Tax=Yinghuangia sp. ASG 101 TaxID=2896848 RepID=UPI001E5D7BBB|nr:STM4015 family protein [Yinghuangia sp. ASG 101]UGQ13293.1 STM4015 family protein [Yinghuangia sp. ASG 101]